VECMEIVQTSYRSSKSQVDDMHAHTHTDREIKRSKRRERASGETVGRLRTLYC
jgi:hypothetical protein